MRILKDSWENKLLNLKDWWFAWWIDTLRIQKLIKLKILY